MHEHPEPADFTKQALLHDASGIFPQNNVSHGDHASYGFHCSRGDNSHVLQFALLVVVRGLLLSMPLPFAEAKPVCVLNCLSGQVAQRGLLQAAALGQSAMLMLHHALFHYLVL